jgi:hypothetical protein
MDPRIRQALEVALPHIFNKALAGIVAETLMLDAITLSIDGWRIAYGVWASTYRKAEPNADYFVSDMLTMDPASPRYMSSVLSNAHLIKVKYAPQGSPSS